MFSTTTPAPNHPISQPRPSTSPNHAFFSLPGELREQIYTHLLISHHPQKLSSGLTATAKNTILPTLLKINKKFSHEYLIIASKLSSLTIDDDPLGSYISPGLKLPYLPTTFRHVSRLEINLTCLGFNAGDEVLFHEGWVAKLIDQVDEIKGNFLEEVGINVHLYSLADIDEYESALLWSGKWVRDGRVKSLRIFKTNIRDLRGAFTDGARGLLMSWNGEKGCFVRVEGQQSVETKGEQDGNVWLSTSMRDAWGR